MARPTAPLFLARASYRRRRLRDAARLLPIVGAFFLLLPLLWASDSKNALTSGEMIYFFGAWVFLIVAAAAFSRGLRVGERAGDEED